MLGSSSRPAAGAIGENPDPGREASPESGNVPIRSISARCDHRGVSFDRRRFVRRHDGRIVAGVAAGLGDALGVDANVVRCGFLVLTLAGGIGACSTAPGGCSFPLPTRARHRRAALTRSRRPRLPRSCSGSCCSCAVGPWPGDVIVWPLAAAMVGLALLSTRRATTRPSRPTGRSSIASRPRRPTRSRCSSARAGARSRGSSRAPRASRPASARSS